ncbi:TPA: ATP-binding cassette domain-containing protein [Klebsiella pneumoniae]
MNTAPKLTVMSDTRFIPAAATPAIEVLSAEKIYSNGTRALLPVNLTINQGEFITLLGPSGCGKSTLLKMVAGLVEPSDGKLMLWRRDSREKAQHPLSFVFQEATLMPWSSVRNNVRLPLDLAGVPRAEGNTRVSEVLELVGLGKFADVLPRELSGGMQMRVSIARGLVTRPKLLLMDEPFGALDEITRNKLDSDLLRLWQEQNLTVVFVTHSIHEAVFPIISNTTQGLRSVSPGLLSYFRLNHASRWQTLVRLRIPSALPYFFGALRISSGLSLIGAVVAEFVAGTGGTNTGLAYQILQAGYQLDIPLMFAALLLISLAGIALFGVMSWVSRRALSAWHESEAVQSH